MRSSRLALVSLLAAACGGNSSGLPPSSDFANLCATPRAGTGDKKGSLDDEKKFLRSWTDELYLWYREVPTLDASKYATAVDYFDALRTPQVTPSGNKKDRFHFTLSTADWERQSQAGVSFGYGLSWVVVGSLCADGKTLGCRPRDFRINYTQPGSPAANILRGTRFIAIDGADFVSGTDPAPLNAGLFPASSGESHRFTLKDPDGTVHDVDLVAAAITETPVQHVQAIATPTGNVGYILFNDHIATAESQLIDAIKTLKAQNVVDLVLDIRYNGGGFLDIASELAYMIAGPARTSGKTFEKLTFNDKYPSRDPVTGQALTPTPFEATAAGFTAPRGAVLPHLDLPRLFVLTSGGTCSASESVINSLMGVEVQVIQIGTTTCGKPYGFYPQDNCGTTYFSIEFKGANAKGFGDYADGFVPGGPGANPVGCHVVDDFGHNLGDANEAQLAAALAYRSSATCPAAPAAQALTLGGGLRGEGVVMKPEWRMNRILRR
jgi:carboxyl-terminal processing protease